MRIRGGEGGGGGAAAAADRGGGGVTNEGVVEEAVKSIGLRKDAVGACELLRGFGCVAAAA